MADLPLHVTAFSFAFLAAFLISIVLIIILTIKSYRLASATWFLIFNIFVALWSAISYIESMIVSIDWYLISNRVGAITFIFVPLVFLYFTLSYTEKSNLYNNFLVNAAIIIPAVIFLYLCAETYLINDYSKEIVYKTGAGFDAVEGELFAVFLLWVELLFALSIYFLIDFYRHTVDSKKKQQIKLVIIGLAVSLLAGTISDGLAPVFGFYLPSLSVPATTVTNIFITYSILKHGLTSVDPSSISQDIVNTMSEGLIVFDGKKVRIINNSALKLLGYSEDYVLNKEISLFFDSEFLTKITLVVNDLKKYKAITQGIEGNIIDRNRAEIPILMYFSILNDESQIPMYILIFHDISQIKEKNSKLKVILADIESHNARLKEMNKQMIDRELQMVELKKQLTMMTGNIVQ